MLSRQPLLVETVKQFHRSGRIVAAICAATATVLVPHDIFLSAI
ncbi:DJ-1/PfpI family protein [Salmonella enterica subsp. enterica]|nr:DJ-1/PfpI family protein [Salmonella enterica subsp. enterica]